MVRSTDRVTYASLLTTNRRAWTKGHHRDGAGAAEVEGRKARRVRRRTKSADVGCDCKASRPSALQRTHACPHPSLRPPLVLRLDALPVDALPKVADVRLPTPDSVVLKVGPLGDLQPEKGVKGAEAMSGLALYCPTGCVGRRRRSGGVEERVGEGRSVRLRRRCCRVLAVFRQPAPV